MPTHVQTHAALSPRRSPAKATQDFADRQAHPAPAAGRGTPRNGQRLATMHITRARLLAKTQAVKRASETRHARLRESGQDRTHEIEFPISLSRRMRSCESARELA